VSILRGIFGVAALSLAAGCNLLLTDWKTSDAVRFCQPGAHAFCESFDDDGYTENWDAPEVAPNATLRLVDDVHVSPPRALKIEMPEMLALKNVIAVLKKTIPMSAPRAVLEFDLLFATPAWESGEPQHNVAFVTLFSDSELPTGVLLFLARDSGEVAKANHPEDGMLTSKPLTTGTFQHVRLEVEQASTTNTIALYVGEPPGELLLSEPYTFDSVPGSAVVLSLGLQRFGHRDETTPPFDVTYDNVTVDFLP
jgi:hypothetical protein